MARRTYNPLYRTPGKVFRASALQREYRRVLDSAREAPVQVLDKDDTVLGVERWENLVFAQGMLDALDDIRQFHAVFARHRDEPPAAWAAMTPFAWLAHFGSEDAAEFAGELMPHLFESLHRRSLEPFLGMIRAWESSTEMLSDPQMMAAVDVDLAAEQLTEVFPPSAEETMADQEAAASA